MDQAPRIAAELLGELGRRWCHVEIVGRLADGLVSEAGLPSEVAAAAWLHDVGYAPGLTATGFHALDGAAFLLREGAPAEVVGLVAWHTGAAFEAAERGLLAELAEMPEPSADGLDALTLLDLVTAPDGALTSPQARVAEILDRYDASSPIHRAVVRSQGDLLVSAERARRRLGLSDVWPAGVLERVR